MNAKTWPLNYTRRVNLPIRISKSAAIMSLGKTIHSLAISCSETKLFVTCQENCNNQSPLFSFSHLLKLRRKNKLSMGSLMVQV